jgi:hypothetical protein
METTSAADSPLFSGQKLHAAERSDIRLPDVRLLTIVGVQCILVDTSAGGKP